MELQCVFFLMDGLSPPPGERWHGGVSPVAEGPEPLLLQAADGSRSLSVFLPGLPAHNTRGGPDVPHRGLVVESLRVCCGFKLRFCVKTLKPAELHQLQLLWTPAGHRTLALVFKHQTAAQFLQRFPGFSLLLSTGRERSCNKVFLLN